MNLLKAANNYLNRLDKKHTKRINADLKRRGMAWLIPEKIDLRIWRVK